MGSFNNKISAEYNPPRKWVLERALSYRDQNIDVDALEKIGMTGIRGHAAGTESPVHRITCKKGFTTDLASVPRICWAFIAPWDVARAVIIHDLLYKSIRQYRANGGDDKDVISKAKKASDDVFHMAMKDAEPSVAGWKIAAAYNAVRMFGRWSIIPNEDNI